MEIYEKGKEEIILIMITDVVDCFIVRSVYSVIDSMQHLRPIKIPITIFQKIILANSYLESKGEAISNYYLLPCQSPHLHLRNQLQLAGVLLGSWNCQAYEKKIICIFCTIDTPGAESIFVVELALDIVKVPSHFFWHSFCTFNKVRSLVAGGSFLLLNLTRYIQLNFSFRKRCLSFFQRALFWIQNMLLE